MTEHSNCFGCKAGVFSIWHYRRKKRIKAKKKKKIKNGRFLCYYGLAGLLFFEYREKNIFVYFFLTYLHRYAMVPKLFLN